MEFVEHKHVAGKQSFPDRLPIQLSQLHESANPLARNASGNAFAALLCRESESVLGKRRDDEHAANVGCAIDGWDDDAVDLASQREFEPFDADGTSSGRPDFRFNAHDWHAALARSRITVAADAAWVNVSLGSSHHAKRSLSSRGIRKHDPAATFFLSAAALNQAGESVKSIRISRGDSP